MNKKKINNAFEIKYKITEMSNEQIVLITTNRSRAITNKEREEAQTLMPCR